MNDGESLPLSSWFPRRAASGQDARRIAALQEGLDTAKAEAENLRRQLREAQTDLQKSNTKRQRYKERAQGLETYTTEVNGRLEQAKQRQLKDKQENNVLEKELDEIRDQLQNTTIKKTALESSIRELRSELQDKEAELETAAERGRELVEIRDQLEQTVRGQTALEARVLELSSELNAEKSKVDEADEELQKLRVAYQELEKKNCALTGANQSLEQSNLELDRKNSSLATDKQALEQENSWLTTTKQSLEQSNGELDGKNSSLAAEKQAVERSRFELEKKNSELEATNQSLKQSNDDLTEQNSELQAINQSLEQSSDELSEQMSELQATNQSLEQSNDDLTEQNSSLILKYETLERSQDELIKSATKEMRILFRKQCNFIHQLLEAKARLQGEVWEFWQQDLGQKLRERGEQIEHMRKKYDEARESKDKADREYSELKRKGKEAEKLAAIDKEKKTAKIKLFTEETYSLRDINQKLYDENESGKESVKKLQKDVDALTEERDEAIQRTESLQVANRVLSEENRDQANQLVQLQNTRKQLDILRGEKAAVEDACAESNRQRAAIEQERDRIASEAGRSINGLQSRLREQCERNKRSQNALVQFAYARLLLCEIECEQATYERAVFLDLHLRTKTQGLQHHPAVSSQLEKAVPTREESTQAFYIDKEPALKADLEALSLKLQLADQYVARLRRTFSNLRDQTFVDIKTAGNVEGTSYTQLFEDFYDLVDDPRVQILKQGKIVERHESSDSCALTTWSEVEEIVGRDRCRTLLEFYECVHDEHVSQVKLLVDGWLLLPPTPQERQRILADGLEGALNAEGVADMAATDDSSDATGSTLSSHVNAEAALLDSGLGSGHTQSIEVAEDKHGNYEPVRAGASTLPTPEVSSPEEPPLSLPNDSARHVSRGKRAHSMDRNNTEQAAKRARNFDPVRDSWSSPPRDPRRHRQPNHAPHHARAGRYDNYRPHERR